MRITHSFSRGDMEREREREKDCGRKDWRIDPKVLEKQEEPAESKRLVKVETAIKQLLCMTGVQTAFRRT